MKPSPRTVTTLQVLFLLFLVGQPLTGQARDDEGRRVQLEKELREARRELSDLKRQLARSERFDHRDGRLVGDLDKWLIEPGFRAQGLAPLTLFGGRARLGMTVVIDGDEASAGRGAAIDSVVPDGPADRVGIKVGDVVTRFDDHVLGEGQEPLARSPAWGSAPSPAADHLRDLARELEDGDEVRLTIERDNETLEVTVVAEALEPPVLIGSLSGKRGALDRARALSDAQKDRKGSRYQYSLAMPWQRGLWHDLKVAPLNPDLGSYFGTERGLLVLEPPSEEVFGLRAGDVLLAIGDRDPRDMTHALRILNSYEPGETVNLEVMRAGSRITLTAGMPDLRASMPGFFDQSQI